MNIEQVRKLIARENQNREEATMDTARRLINRISELQTQKAECDKEMAECREELRKLSTNPLNEADIVEGF